MNFSPILPSSGLLGWRFLERTQDTQKTVLSQTPEIKRDTENFAKKIGSIESAEALVADRSLLKVALGAFGLENDLDNKFFIKKVLEDGSTNQNALANRLADKRYLEFSRAFGFGDDNGPNTNIAGFAEGIIKTYQDRSFEVAVGEQDGDLRLVLGLERDLGELAQNGTSNDTKWFTIMGTPPLRAVFETAFGLPTGFGALPIDNQLKTLKERAEAVFGSDQVSQFTTAEKQDELKRQFLLISEIGAGNQLSSGSVALTLLQSIQPITV